MVSCAPNQLRHKFSFEFRDHDCVNSIVFIRFSIHLIYLFAFRDFYIFFLLMCFRIIAKSFQCNDEIQNRKMTTHTYPADNREHFVILFGKTTCHDMNLLSAPKICDSKGYLYYER